MIVTLTLPEFSTCVANGFLRFAFSEARGLNHASTYKRTWMHRLGEEITGACGERAFCKYRGIYWDSSVNTFHGQPDAGDRWEVRATRRDDGCLIVRDNDPPDRLYVLVTGEPPRMTVRGYLPGSEARIDAYARNPNDYRPAWFVPQSALRRLEDL